ncbi:hypothetical protein QBC38DRAFT_132414 [Podospora fimiseda]|uniref:Glutamyl-tRNA amidotransferase complex subunit Gta3 domain-containing protein n=1 Tax=Podospora fimiseda TaxID=252190 RepID=A0AAN7BTX1_9PEZI|nr:hypothetical protein QBC38DRAFT_132414 [Podospora fimiseda]
MVKPHLPRTTPRHSSTIRTLLSKPTWSISSLLPQQPPQSPSPQPNISIPHLLRLSSLPLPSTPQHLSSITSTLHSQLHFVHAIQQINTTNIQPLSSIRDETTTGLQESTISLSHPVIQKALSQEKIVGKWKRPRRKQPTYFEQQREEGPAGGAGEVEGENSAATAAAALKNWDVLGTASEKVGGYFVVRSGKGE